MPYTIHAEVPDHATVRDAFTRLQPTESARWGTMNAPAMVEHVARFNETYLGQVPVAGWMRVLARLLGGFFIRKYLATSPFAMKRGMTTMPTLRIAPDSVDAQGFEKSRARLIRTFEEIEAMEGTWDHPIYGRIDAEVGRALARHHAAHHLRQFGLL